MNKSQEVIEISKWMYPAFFLSGWLSPLIFILSWLWEVFRGWV